MYTDSLHHDAFSCSVSCIASENALRFKLFTKLYGSLSTFTWDLKISLHYLTELYEDVVKGHLYVTFTLPLRNFTNLKLYATLHDSVKLRKGFP